MNSVPIVWNRCTAYSTEDICKGWAAQAKASTGAHHRALSLGTPEISSKLLKNHANALAVSARMTMLVLLKIAGSGPLARQWYSTKQNAGRRRAEPMRYWTYKRINSSQQRATR